MDKDGQEDQPEYTEDNHPHRRADDYDDERDALSFYASMAVIIGVGLFVTVLFGGGLYFLFVERVDWVINTFRDHFAALIATPLAMVGSMAVVLVLKYTDGPVEFDAPLGVKFKGAAAPIVFWVLIFSVNITAIKWLW